MTIFWIVLGVIVVIVLSSGYYFTRVIIYPKVHPYEEVYSKKVEEKEFEEEDWKSWQKEEIWVDSPYGYSLHGYWLPVPDSKKTVVLVHGITMNLFASIKYVMPFKKRGFNVLMYDHRNHGKSGGNNTTFGYKEKHDLKAMIDWVENRVGSDSVIGTHGESMGAGTIMQHAAIDDRVKFVVEDCGYADLTALFRYRFQADFHLRGWLLLPVASVFGKLIAGFFYSEVKPVRAIEDLDTPMFFIHGIDDTYIPSSHAEELFNAKKNGLKKLWLAPGAKHAESETKNPELYDQKIGEFLDEVFQSSLRN
ncbi:MAG: alpha/beta hydrolase [Anaerolineaceae bacterium]|nr:alpha/beta hydrolase [Anaerolineaceae bacterium]